MTRLNRAALAIDKVQDVWGEWWLVAEQRPAAHGFEVLIGWPVGGGPRAPTVILTAALAEYLTATERRRDIALPVSIGVVKRLRSALGLRFDWHAWWAAREADLTSMTLEQFCARHHCSMGAASQRRAAARG